MVFLWTPPGLPSPGVSTLSSISPQKHRFDDVSVALAYVALLTKPWCHTGAPLNPKPTLGGIPDISSIAKGYAVDEVSLFLLKSGYYNYLVEIGGELRAHGKNNNHNWRVGIYNPINNSKNIINLNNMSIATSGTYNNYFVHDGIEYSHIINPKTGYPIKNEILSVTVITENCIEADALATMGMTIEDSHQAIQIIENEEANALIIRKNKNGEILKFPTNNFSKYLEN